MIVVGQPVRRLQARRSRRGANLVEGSFILLLLMGLIFAIMDFALLVYTQNVLTYAAREGTRFAMVRGADSRRPVSASDITNLVRQRVPGLTPSTVSVTTTWEPDNVAGSLVQVRVSVAVSERFTIFAPLSLTLASVSQATIQQ